MSACARTLSLSVAKPKAGAASTGHTQHTHWQLDFFFVCPFCRETLVAFSELGHFNIHVGISRLATMKADQLQVVALAAARGWALGLFVTTIEKCSAGEKRRERTQNSLEAES